METTINPCKIKTLQASMTPHSLKKLAGYWKTQQEITRDQNIQLILVIKCKQLPNKQ